MNPILALRYSKPQGYTNLHQTKPNQVPNEIQKRDKSKNQLNLEGSREIEYIKDIVNNYDRYYFEKNCN